MTALCFFIVKHIMPRRLIHIAATVFYTEAIEKSYRNRHPDEITFKMAEESWEKN